MRKYIQKQLLEMLDTLLNANRTILKTQSDSILCELLSDCQSFALKIGNTIESSEGKGTKAVSLLEDYCEGLYRISQTDMSVKELGKEADQLDHIISGVKNNINLFPRTKLMVFLPYKASMWDSLESVWIEAKKDESCEAIVLPIPYYERTPEGKLGELHYEGDMFPENVPVRDWRSLDLEAVHPDVIFIHNPYDEANTVTSIAPAYYSDKIKNYSELLVYIPYFVGIEDNVTEPLCLLPGVFNANLVVVESKAVKSTYIKALRKFEKDIKKRGYFGNLNHKIVSLGSPKIDKASNLNRENFVFPSEWNQRVYKADGNRKNVIFYNTSIGTLLNATDTYMEKLRTVFEDVSKMNDIVLLWRPHPLTEETLKSMLPAMYQEYMELVHEYKTKNVGIYDDSGDPQMAMAFADAYYGDASSLITLWQKTGKPLLWQNVKKRGLVETGTDAPFFIGMTAIDDEIYAIQYDRSNIIKFSPETKEIHTVYRIADSNSNQLQTFHYLYREGNKLYLIPFRESYLGIYDLTTKEFNSIKLICDPDLDKTDMVTAGKFYGCCRYKNILYLLPFGYHAIVAVDLETGNQRICFDFNGTVINGLNAYFNPYEYMDETHIVMTCFYSNHLVILDLETGTCEIKELGNKSYYFTTIKRYKNEYWILVKNTLILLKWKPEDNSIEEFNAFPNGIRLKNNRHCFDGETVHIYRNFMYCFPAACTMAIKVNLANGEISEIKSLRELSLDKKLNPDISTFDGCVRIGDVLYLQYQLQKILRFNMANESIEIIDKKVSKENLIKHVSDQLLTLIDSSTEQRKIAKDTSSCGRKIYAYITEHKL